MREDHKLQAAVFERLDMNPAINASHIGVVARAGVVTLSGHVPTLVERAFAEEVAGAVKESGGLDHGRCAARSKKYLWRHQDGCRRSLPALASERRTECSCTAHFPFLSGSRR